MKRFAIALVAALLAAAFDPASFSVAPGSPQVAKAAPRHDAAMTREPHTPRSVNRLPTVP